MTKRKSAGRPRVARHVEFVGATMPRDIVRRVEAFAFARQVSRPAAMRELIEAGLKAAKPNHLDR